MSAKRVSVLAASLVLAGVGGALAGLIGACGSRPMTRPGSPEAPFRLTSSAHPRSPSRSQLARSDAALLLTFIRLPPGSERVAREPSGDAGLLSSPGETISGNIVDLHRFYVVAEDPTHVDAFVMSHRPQGSTRAGYGTGGVYGDTDRWFVSYSWPPVKTLLNNRVLVISIAALTDDRSGVRVDAEVTWLPAKPAGDIIPTGAKVLTAVLSAGLNPGETGHAPVTTTDPEKIEAIRDFINRLGVFPPGAWHCPADFGQDLTISFATSPAATPFDVVVAGTSGCEGVQVQHLGRTVQPELWGLEPPIVPFVEGELGFS